MDKVFNNFSRNASEKNKALDKIKEERAKRQKAESDAKYGKIILDWWKSILSYENYLNGIYQDTEKKFKDIETLTVYLSKNSNTKFTIPLNIHCQMITNLCIYFTYYSKKLILRKSIFTKYKKNDQQILTKLKNCLGLFEKLLQFSISAIDNPKNIENIYFYTIAEESSLDKPKKELKQFSTANLKCLLRMSFLTIEITHSNSEIYQSNILNKTIEFLHLVLDPNGISKFETSLKTSFISLYHLITSLSVEFESKKQPLTRPIIGKPLVQIFGGVLQRSISIRKENIPDEQILLILHIIAYFSNLYCYIGSKDRANDNRNYDFFLKFQSDFFVHIMSIPRFAKFIKPIVDESIYKHLPKKYTLNHKNLDIFNVRFWKDICQAFLFYNFADPYVPIVQLAESFRKKFDSSNQIFFIFGNLVEIFHDIIADLSVWEYFSSIKIISLCCFFITTNWLSSIVGTFEVDRDYWCLKDQVQKLFDTQFVQDLFFKVFEIDEENTEEEKIDTSKGKKKKHEPTPIDLQSHVHFNIIELYAQLLALCQPSDQLQALITNFANALAFKKQFIRKLYNVFQSLFIDSIDNKKDHCYFELRNEMFSLLNIFVTLYYNYLLITDSDDFVTQNHFSLAEIQGISLTILKLSVNLNWNMDIIKENKIKMFYAYQSAKLIRLIQEYNLNLKFLNTKDFTIDKSWVKHLRQDIAGKNNFRTLYLKRLPFTLPFEARLAIFQDYLKVEKEINTSVTKILIRRASLFEDGFNAFTKLGNNFLKGKLQVTFVDEFGQLEEGIDAGGLFKEFLVELSKIIFNPSYGMFKVSDNEQTLYPNPESDSYLGAEHLVIFHFVGLVVGRAIFDNILIETEFAQFFLRKILGKINYVNELQSLDKEMFNNLKFLKSYKGDVADLFLTFSVTDSSNKEVELIPNGKHLPVTNENKFKYIYAVANHKLHTEIKNQSKAFMNGLSVFVTSDWLQIFNEEEMQIVISGAKKAFDVDDLKSHTAYKGYTSFDSNVRDFWKVFSEFTEQEKILLLKFVTSCSRPPLLGFSHLHPQFTIQYVENQDGEKLPTASTCFNILKLPKYSNKKKLKDKLLLAIKSGSGFNMA